MKNFVLFLVGILLISGAMALTFDKDVGELDKIALEESLKVIHNKTDSPNITNIDKITIQNQTTNETLVDFTLNYNSYFCANKCTANITGYAPSDVYLFDSVDTYDKEMNLRTIDNLTVRVFDDKGKEISEKVKYKGTFTILIEGWKKAKETVDWIIDTSFGVLLSEWALWEGVDTIYDEINDSSIDTNLWDITRVQTTSAGSTTSSQTENTDYLQMQISNTGSYDWAGWSRDRLNATDGQLTMDTVDNLSMQIYMEGYRSNGGGSWECAYNKLYVWGVLLKTYGRCDVSGTSSETSLYEIVVNDSSIPSFDWYDDDVYQGTFNGTSDDVYLEVWARAATSRTSRATSKLYYVYYADVLGDVTAPTWVTAPTNDSMTYGTAWDGITFNATDDVAVSDYFVNDSRFTINSTGFLNVSSTLASANYSLNISVNDTAGNVNSTSFVLEVEKAPGVVYAYINGSRANFSTDSDTGNNTYLNGTLETGIGDISMYLNGTLINSGSSPLSNLTNFSVGEYWFNVTYAGNANYTSAEESWFLNITEPDYDNPIINTSIETGDVFYKSTGDAVEIILVYNITEPNFNSANYTLSYANGTSLLTNLSSGQNEIVSFNQTLLDEFIWEIHADDLNGNSATKIIRFALDLNPDKYGSGKEGYEIEILEESDGVADEGMDATDKLTAFVIGCVVLLFVAGLIDGKRK